MPSPIAAVIAGSALLGGGDLDQHVGPVDGRPQLLGRGDRGLGSLARSGSTSIETRPSAAVRRRPAQHVAGVADVVVVSSKITLVDVGALGASSRDLGVVALALGDARGEDRGVGGHPDHRLALHELGEVAGLDALAGEVVEPDGDARVRECLQSVGHRFLLVVVVVRSAGDADAVAGGVGHGLGGDAELAVDARVVGRGAVVLDRDDPAGVADHLAPALGDAGLDRDPGLHGRRDDGLAVGRLLGVEPLAARHRDHAGPDAVGGEQLAGLDRQLDLGAGADQHDVGRSPVGVEQHVAAAVHVGGVGEALLAAREDRQVLPAQGQPGRAVGVLQDRLQQAAVSLASAGRTTSSPGIARSAAGARSAGGWGRPRRGRSSRGSTRR